MNEVADEKTCPANPQHSGSQSAEELRTPVDWAAAEGIRIFDTDGWKGRGARSFDEPITYAEFSRRVTDSSCEMPVLRLDT
jgi:hypothetical protein